MIINGVQFREVVVADFEFRADPGERQGPNCLVAWELNSGQKFHLWEDELRKMTAPPYATGKDVLFCAWFASAELGCHLSLGWELPEKIIDLYVEFRVLTNGQRLPLGNNLLGSMAYFGFPAITVREKEEMRKMSLRGGPWTAEEKRALLAYCEEEVKPLPRLLEKMAPHISFHRALLRGAYTAAVARMEFIGVPIDTEALEILRTNWESIKTRLISEIDRGYGVYEGTSFKMERFARWLVKQGISWPRLDSRRLDLKSDTFKDMAKIHPKVAPLKELQIS